MLVRIFKKASWHAPVILISLALLFWFGVFLEPDNNVAGAAACSTPLYAMLAEFWGYYPVGAAIFSLLLLLVQAFYLNYLATSNAFTDRYSALPGLIYLLLMSSTPSMISLNPVLMANLFLIPAMNKLVDVYEEERIAKELFNSGLLIGLATLFYYPALVLFVALIASVFVYYIFSLRRLIAALLGLITPIVFILVWFFLQDEILLWHEDPTSLFQPMHVPDLNITLSQKLFIGGLALFSLLSFAHLQFVYKAAKPIRIRKRITLLFLLFLISSASYLFAINFLHLHYGLLNITLSIALAIYFYDMRYRKLTEVLFTALLILVLAGRFAGSFLNG